MSNNASSIEYCPDKQVAMQVQWVILLFIYLLGVLTYGIYYYDSFFHDADSPWHLVAGDAIRAMGSVPDRDPWAFTTGDAKWYNISWLYDVTISWFNAHLGFTGLLAVNVLLAALTPAVLARICFFNGAGVIATLASSAVALIMLKSCFALRPQQFALLLIAIMFLQCCKFRYQQDHKIWLVPILTALLVNVHGSFLLVFALLGAFWLEALCAKDWSRTKTLTLIGIACVVATFINPFTYEIYYASWLTIGSELGRKHISEWQPAGLSTHPHIYLYALILFIVPLFYRVKLFLADKILLVFWVVMALNSARYNVVLTLFITPFFALYLHALVSHHSKLQQTDITIQNDMNNPNAGYALMGTVVLVIGFLLNPASRNAVWTKELYDPEKYPVKEIAYLMEHAKDEHIMNHYNYGGYLLYQARGSIKPFVDGRANTAYSKEFLNDYIDIESFNYGWEELLAKYDIEWILLPNEMKNIEIIKHSPNWHSVYEGDVATIYKKGRG